MITESTSDRTPTRRSGGFISTLSLIVAIVLLTALVVFVLQNTVHTTINFLAWNFDLAQGVSLLGAAVVGAVIALIVSAAIRLRRAVR
ncbi:LapA family protein [Mycolicibacterium arenosum]|uniref:Lipopolysaccharide assembly protein LapA domain-containing protein n=1 Tax=Mycolicibacterium arenosum TaxID=2952157 RepID=A0ABT1M3B8_9MYCO|nr:lipopolysaccharide assembly protein LapA domain-containing protein [Mycolicibacterium sp. CAU 1645]MCP9273656.1 lipopolysaccharide assembly protein LapA domain-containing protein [Mycolicibacterium sp. CAU 1645]